jgi:hypothetical protein
MAPSIEGNWNVVKLLVEIEKMDVRVESSTLKTGERIVPVRETCKKTCLVPSLTYVSRLGKHATSPVRSR